MKIGIGNDHTGVAYKQVITQHLQEKYGYEVVDFGTNSTDSSNYPEPGKNTAQAVVDGIVDLGILICGTGVGIGIAANKVKGARCCITSDPYTARLSRQHNNTNLISFGARVIGIEMAKMIVDEWLSVSFEGGRHATRVAMISAIEDENTDSSI